MGGTAHGGWGCDMWLCSAFSKDLEATGQLKLSDGLTLPRVESTLLYSAMRTDGRLHKAGYGIMQEKGFLAIRLDMSRWARDLERTVVPAFKNAGTKG